MYVLLTYPSPDVLAVANEKRLNENKPLGRKSSLVSSLATGDK